MLLMPFAGFTPLSVISLVTCQLYCKAKHHWEDTAYKTSPTWGTFVFQIMSGSHTMAGSETPASLGIAHLHLQIAQGQMCRGDVLRLNRVQYSPVSLLWAPVCRYKPTKTMGFEYWVICLLCMDHQPSFSAQHLHCHYAFSKRSPAHTSLYSILLASLPQYL